MAAITITNVGLNMMRDSLKAVGSPTITYVALGTSATAPAATDTQLGTEVFREAVTSYANGGATGEILINMYLAPNDIAGTTVQEVGFFGGAATGAANSGTLLAHGLYSHAHTNLESIQFQLDLTI